MKARLLITGANGFVGYHLIQAALEKGFDVYAGVRASADVSHLRSMPVTITTLEYMQPDQLNQLFEENKFDYVIHAAGAVKANREEQYFKVNADYTKHLGLAAKHSGGVKKFVLISSLAAYGPSAGQAIIDGSAPPSPVTSYGRSKLQAEKYLTELDLPWIILRPTAVYGPREQELFVIIRAVANGVEPYIGRGAQQLSFVYVKDLADVAVDALTSPVERAAYFISDGIAYDRYALADSVKTALARRTLKVHIPVTLMSGVAWFQEKLAALNNRAAMLNREKLNELTAKNWVCSIDPARRDLGFEPRYQLNDGMKETLKWYKQQHWL